MAQGQGEVNREPAGPTGPEGLSGIDSKYSEILPRQNPNPTPPPEISISPEFELVAVGCKSRFCDCCAPSMGIKLKERLIPALSSFESPMMLTLTVDPKLFPSGEGAYRHVRKVRAISGLVRELYRKGFLNSKRFFYVLEFQPISGNPHWHLVVDSAYVPFESLKTAWNRYIPEGVGPERLRVGLGSVKLSPSKFQNGEAAAHYVAKYIIKKPEGGWPSWVLIFRGTMRRYGVSRGFWSVTEKPKPREKSSRRAGKVYLRRKSVAEQLAKCGKRAVIVAKVEFRKVSEVAEKHYRFIAECSSGFAVAVRSLGLQLTTPRRASISREQIIALDLSRIRGAPLTGSFAA